MPTPREPITQRNARQMHFEDDSSESSIGVVFPSSVWIFAASQYDKDAKHYFLTFRGWADAQAHDDGFAPIREKTYYIGGEHFEMFRNKGILSEIGTPTEDASDAEAWAFALAVEDTDNNTGTLQSFFAGSVEVSEQL